MKVNTVTGDLKVILNKLKIKYGITYSDPRKDGMVSVKLVGVELNPIQIQQIKELMELSGYIFHSSTKPTLSPIYRSFKGTRLCFSKGINFIKKQPVSKPKNIELYTIALTSTKGSKESITIEKHIITEEDLIPYKEEDPDEDNNTLARRYIYENYCMEFHQMFIECIIVDKKQLESIKAFYIR